MKVTSCTKNKTSTPGLLLHTIIVKAKNLKKQPFANIRLPDEDKGDISRNVKYSARNHTDQFVAMTNGINSCATKVDYNERTGEVTIIFGNDEGEQNGGHLEAALLSLASDPQAQDAEVMIMIYTGLKHETKLARPKTLNAQRDVPLYAHDNYAGVYDNLKKTLRSTPVYKTINWMPNEADTGITPRDVIQTWALMNVYNDTVEPNRYLYGGAKLQQDTPALLAAPVNQPGNKSILRYTGKMLAEMLYLADYIQYALPDTLAKTGVSNLNPSTIFVSYEKDRFGYIQTDSFGGYVRKKAPRQNAPLPFLWDKPGVKAERKLAKTYMYPILWGLRALIDKNGEWLLGDLDETKKFWDTYGGEILAELDLHFFRFITGSSKRGRVKVETSPEEFGRNSDSYEICETNVSEYLKEYMRMKLKRGESGGESAAA